jgi:hypothetical protein
MAGRRDNGSCGQVLKEQSGKEPDETVRGRVRPAETFAVFNEAAAAAVTAAV